MTLAGKKKKIFDGRYEILSIVGRGAASVVYHARHANTPANEVALKVLLNDKDSRSSGERLRKEALAMVSSRHKYVIRLDDFHSVGDLCYLSMEYAPEYDLRKFAVKQGGRISPVQAELFLMQLAEALNFIHRAGIVHRDIKPDNFLVVSDKEIRLGDFGVAVLPGEISSIEELQSGVGTMDYMAPEVFEGRAYDQRSDIYSLGVSFYEVLTGKHPFENVPLAAQLEARKPGRFTHIQSLSPEVPTYLAQAVMQAMEYDPAKRFPSAKELAQAILINKSKVNQAQATKAEPKPKIRPTSAPQPADSKLVAAVEKQTAQPTSQAVQKSIPTPPAQARKVIEDVAETIVVRPGLMAVPGSGGAGSSNPAEEGTAKAYSKTPVALATTSQPRVHVAVAETQVVTPPKPLVNTKAAQSNSPRMGNVAIAETVEFKPDAMGAAQNLQPLSPRPAAANAETVSKSPKSDPAQPEDLQRSMRQDAEMVRMSKRKTQPVSRDLVEKVRSEISLDTLAAAAPIGPASPPVRLNHQSAKAEPATPMPVTQRLSKELERKSSKKSAYMTASIILFFLMLYSGNIFLKRRYNIDITQKLIGSAEEPTSPIPEFQGGDLAFPQIPVGMYVGTLDGLVPGQSVALTIIVLPDKKSAHVVLGLEGWTAPLVSLEPLAKNTPPGEARRLIRVMSGGFVLDMAGQVAGGELIGYFENVVSGEHGEWRAKPVSS